MPRHPSQGRAHGRRRMKSTVETVKLTVIRGRIESMSFGLDILTTDVDGNEHWIDVVDGHTYNLTPMWCKALPFIYSTMDLDGRSCSSLIPELDAGLLDATKNAAAYEALNPANGWGDYEGFYRIFAKFVRLCNQYPSGVVRWNG